MCVAPVHVDREDFFSEMLEMLRQHPEITDLKNVPDAFVPVISFDFCTIPVLVPT